MKLLIIGHGQSGDNLLDVYGGHEDYDLTRKGHEQSQLMSEWVASNYSVNKIYHSPLKRALQTAQHLSELTNAVLCSDDDLTEFNFGLLTGMPKEEAAVKYPDIPDQPVHTANYEQESILTLRYRADMILTKVIHDNKKDDIIAVITHSSIINQLYHSFFKLPICSKISIHTFDTGIHYWSMDGEKKNIIFANCDAHLRT